MVGFTAYQPLLSYLMPKSIFFLLIIWFQETIPGDCMNVPTQGHKEDTKKSKERLITAANNSDNNRNNYKHENNNKKSRKQKWEEK